MNKLLEYKDPVILIETGQDGYGDHTIIHAEHLKGLFVQGTSISRANYTEMIGTDAHIYLDIENKFVRENAFRLEGMYLVINLLGGKESDAWYKIERCKVGQRKLLENDINNIHCFLSKSDPLPYEES